MGWFVKIPFNSRILEGYSGNLAFFILSIQFTHLDSTNLNNYLKHLRYKSHCTHKFSSLYQGLCQG